MSSSQEKVLEMVARGELSADQADSLLGAMARKRARLRVLWRPLDVITTGQALLAGAIAAAAAFALGAAGVRFDGALDLHMTPHAAALAQRTFDLLVSWPLPALLFWLGARAFGKRARVIDFFAAVSVARVPYVLGAAVLLALPGPQGSDDPLRYVREHAAQTALTAIVALCLLVWLVTLLYNGVKTASGLSGWKFGVAFALLLVLAEVASKLVLHAAI